MDLLGFYLRAQSLDKRRPARDLMRVVRELTALQAQAPGTPAMTLAARVDGASQAKVDDLLLKRKRLLKLWSLRGTLHIAAAEDLPLIHAGVMRGARAYCHDVLRRRNGMTPSDIRRVEGRILRALEDGPKTRSEIEREALKRKSLYWGIEIRSLATAGLVVHAGRKGGEVLFDLLERWAPKADLGSIKAEYARRELLLRYLAAYAPASVRDFAYWLGCGVREAADAFEAARDELFEPWSGLFILRRHRDRLKLPSRRPPPRLLPRYDVFLLGHKDKSRYIDERHRRKVFREAAIVESVFLIDGRAAGIWSDKPALSFRPFGRLSARDRARLASEHRGLKKGGKKGVRPFL